MRHDLTLELSAIKCIFQHEAGEELFTQLIAEDFFCPEYKTVFNAMLDCTAKGMGANFPMVCVKLNGVKWWEDIGGSAWLAKEIDTQIPYRPLHMIAPALRELTILRMQEALKLGAGDVQENIAELEKARDAYLGLLPSEVKSVADFKHLLLQEDHVGIPTGFNGIDNLMGGMLGGQFIVVGARTGVGKSVFLMNVAAHVASKNKKVLWIALEMSEREVLKRFCKLLDEKAHPDSLDYLNDMKIISGSKTVAQVESEVMRNDYDLVILDYLQLCRCERRYDNDVQELQEITRRLKLLSMKQNTVVLAAAQLNRESEQNARTPRLSDLRGSGSIEQDADVVILMHRLLRDEDQSKVKSIKIEKVSDFVKQGDTTIFVEKNRNGHPGIVDMNFDPIRLQFIDNSPLPPWV